MNCGTEFFVDGVVKNKKRCDRCQLIHDTERNRLRVQKHREVKKNTTV